MSMYVAIGLISAATLLLEISFLRLFAVQQFYHFAFMAISLALLGAGASGSLLSVRGRRWSPALQSLVFGLTTILSYLIINYLPFDSFSIAWDGRQPVYLAIYFLAAAVPFLFAGLVVGGELTTSGEAGDGRTHKIYGANLLGSGLGSLASLLVLTAVGGEGAVLVSTILGLLAALLFLRCEKVGSRLITAPGRQITALVTVILMMVCLRLLFRPSPFWEQRLSPYKTLSILSHAIDARHTVRSWNNTSRVDVIESSTIHVMPGLSLTSPVGPPPQIGLMIDGDNLMPITNLDPFSKDAALLADHLPLGLLFRLRPQAKTLVLDAGTSTDVLWALAEGAEKVTAVEENSLIISTLRDDYGEYTYNLLDNPRVDVVNQAGRAYARQPDSPRFDAVIVSLNDPHRPVTSGAFSLTEDTTYTVEAVEDYLSLLQDDGLLVMTRWLQTPPSESARLFAMVAQALSQRGLDPAQYIIAFRSLRTMTLLAGLRPFDDEAIDTTHQFLQERGYDAVAYPGISPEELNRYNVLEEPHYYTLFQDILHDPERVYQHYRFDIRPPTDNHPFFYHFFRWRQTPEILATLGMTWQPFGGSGFFVLVILLVLVSVAATIFILGPLLVWQRKGLARPSDIPYWRARVFLYFSCLGLAYLFVEIPLAQRFILSLGQPVTALAVVLFALLLFSGIGSLSVKRWRLRPALGILVVLVAIYPFLLRPITDFALAWSEWGRILLIITVLAPIGYFMGQPFAGGLEIVKVREPELVPWSWAINGSFSVISSVLAVLIALTWGYASVLWLGAAAYCGALVVFGSLSIDTGA